MSTTTRTMMKLKLMAPRLQRQLYSHSRHHRVAAAVSANELVSGRRSLSSMTSTRGADATDSPNNNENPNWSHSLSYATPEYDFITGSTRLATTPASEWSQSLSFASPESDFTSSTMNVGGDNDNTAIAEAASWTQSLSYASPESDFTAANVEAAVASSNETNNDHQNVWSHALSYTSPESDFTSMMMVSSPATALGAIHSHEVLGSSLTSTDAAAAATTTQANPMMIDLEQSLFLMSSPECATGQSSAVEMLDETTKTRIDQYYTAKQSLPTTLEDAMMDERPIVITSPSSPFQIVDVNPAWTTLCGYTREEAQGQQLQDLLQGPETDTQVATGLVRQLHDGHENVDDDDLAPKSAKRFAQASLINYTKDGRKFENLVSVGVITGRASNNTDDHDDDESSTLAALQELYFVGVLNDMTKKHTTAAV